MLKLFSVMGDLQTEIIARRQLIDGTDPIIRQLLSEAGDTFAKQLPLLGVQEASLDIIDETTGPLMAGDAVFPAGRGMGWSLRVPCPFLLWYISPILSMEIPMPSEDDLVLLTDRIGIEFVRVARGTNELSRTVFEMRYEVGQISYPMEYPLELWQILGDNDWTLVGFLDFLTGPFCSIEALTLVGEVTGDGIGESICLPGGDILPPKPSTVADGPGIMLTNQRDGDEWFVQYGADGLVGETEVTVHEWLRVFLVSNMTWPTPGEFIGLAVRPLDSHPWWFQDSSPFLHGANWFETDCYSSGIVTEVIPEGDPGGIGDVGATYRVRIKEESVLAKPTDFAEYAVDDRVTLLKKWDSTAGSMVWRDLGVFDNWVILPVTFY